jgi:hypothetical protein
VSITAGLRLPIVALALVMLSACTQSSGERKQAALDRCFEKAKHMKSADYVSVLRRGSRWICLFGSGRGGSESTATCPDLLEPGPNARSHATWTAMQWAEGNQDSEASGFKVAVAPAKGDPQGPCKGSVWDRSWVATVRWKYPPNSPAAESASLGSSTILEGRTARSRRVWKVWFQFH